MLVHMHAFKLLVTSPLAHWTAFSSEPLTRDEAGIGAVMRAVSSGHIQGLLFLEREERSGAPAADAVEAAKWDSADPRLALVRSRRSLAAGGIAGVDFPKLSAAAAAGEHAGEAAAMKKASPAGGRWSRSTSKNASPNTIRPTSIQGPTSARAPASSGSSLKCSHGLNSFSRKGSVKIAAIEKSPVVVQAPPQAPPQALPQAE